MHPQKIASIKKFVSTFANLLNEKNVSQKLQGYIFDRLVCFGPKRLGSNLLINKFDKFENSFFRSIEQQLDTELLPKFEYDEKTLKQNEDNI